MAVREGDKTGIVTKVLGWERPNLDWDNCWVYNWLYIYSNKVYKPFEKGRLLWANIYIYIMGPYGIPCQLKMLQLFDLGDLILSSSSSLSGNKFFYPHTMQLFSCNLSRFMPFLGSQTMGILYKFVST